MECNHRENEMQELKIRVAVLEDTTQLLHIYEPYVRETAITFEYQVPTVEEFSPRIQKVLQKYPYLVAEQAGEILGYAYASTFHERKAYDWAVETSIYVKQDKKKCGIGKRLYHALEQILKLQGFLNMNACIAFTPKPDAHLTNDSVGFHEHMGYRLVGQFYQCGYKFHHWYDMVWMEKHIGSHDNIIDPIIPFCQLPRERLEEFCIETK